MSAVNVGSCVAALSIENVVYVTDWLRMATGRLIHTHVPATPNVLTTRSPSIASSIPPDDWLRHLANVDESKSVDESQF